MESFQPAAFATFLALVGLVVVVASLASGLIERTGLPGVGLFLVLGLLLGPRFLGLMDFGLTSPALGSVATLSLVLVLFTDALSLSVTGLKTHLRLATLVLGPGTLLSTVLIALTAWALLGVSPAQAAVLGAALGSTDPVMMRSLLRRPEVPPAARAVLGIESGLNDVVVLPIVLIAMAFLGASDTGAGEVARVSGSVFLLGPLAGGVIGFVAVSLLEAMRRRFGLRRDYESLYVLGVAFTAYAGAEALHASGFMAAFVAGLTINLIDVELCDCFRDYGEATSEMFLLFTFVTFGTSLIWSGLSVLTPAELGFALVALFSRSLVLHLTLPRTGLDPDSRRLIVWFGPRALSSLLLVLLPVFAGISGAERLFPVTALVVLLSVVVHGGMLMWRARGAPKPQLPARAVSPTDTDLVRDRELITFEELRGLEASGIPYRLVDVRSPGSYQSSDLRAKGAIRIDPEHPVESAAELALPRHEWLVAFCA